jgi:hypothetical protein
MLLPAEPPIAWLNTLANKGELALNAVVLTLAILSPITDMAVELAFNPDIPANKDPIMIFLLMVGI